MKRKRSKAGGTLALVVALILVLVIVGLAFIVWQFLIGGGAQVRNLTDSGVLNVAKKALSDPSLPITAGTTFAGVNVLREFGDLLDSDPNTGTKRVTLETYNRLVAKCVFAQLNAVSANQAGNVAGVNNAKVLTACVNQIGTNLASRLNNFNNLKANFESVAKTGDTNKLINKGGGPESNNIRSRNEHAVAFSAKPSGGVRSASNVFIDPSQFPPGTNPSFVGSNCVVKKIKGVDRTFLVGYAPLTSAAAAGAGTTYCVPLRPGEQPHSVSLADFNAPGGLQVPPPLAGIGQVVPNTFREGSEVDTGLAGNTFQNRSCAVVGLPQVFPAGVQTGTIIVDNAGTLTSSKSGDAPTNGFAKFLMEPDAAEIFTLTLSPPCHFLDGSNSRKYIGPCQKSDFSSRPTTHLNQQQKNNFQNLDPAGPAIFPADSTIQQIKRLDGALMNGEDQFCLIYQSPRYVSQFAERNTIMQTSGTQGTAFPGALKGSIPAGIVCSSEDLGPGGSCSSEFAALESFANGTLGTGLGPTLNGLMHLEAYILAVRGQFSGGSAGCITVSNFAIPGGDCQGAASFVGSGLKDVPDGSASPPGSPPWSTTPSLRRIMTICGANPDDPANPVGQSIRADLKARANQIVGEVPDANTGGNGGVETILNSIIPFQSIQYISRGAGGEIAVSPTPPTSLLYRGNNQTYDQQDPRTRPLPDTSLGNIPDGTVLRSTPRLLKISAGGSVGGGSGFVPSFNFECGSGMATGVSSSKARWHPSSGRGGLLGVLRFINCPEAGGPDYCCP